VADIPESIGKYKILSLVAKGGMGAVYKAVHPTLKRNVIIKKLTIRGNQVIVERFKREARILMDLDDPRIVHFFDYFKEGTSHYIVLELVDGCSLDSLIRKRRYLSAPLALYIFLEACKALSYAHQKGIIHRDIKPGNILISKTGAVKLADFGIAASEDSEDGDLTKTGTTLGTASYMPPEQFSDSKTVDSRADIYALGVMLYEMVTGKRPFPGNFAPETLYLIQKGKYPNPAKLNPDIPRIARTLIKKMIQPSPKKRYQNLNRVIRIIERYLHRFSRDEIQKALVAFVARDGVEEPFFKVRARKRVVIPVVLSTVLCIAGICGYAWKTGLIHRTILSRSYGELAVSLRLPTQIKQPEDVFIKARLYVNDGSDFPEVPVSPLSFTLAEDHNDSRVYRFESSPVYLAPGQYRIKVMVEGRVYWKSFTLYPLKGSNGEDGDTLSLSFSLAGIESLPLSLTLGSYDAVSGRNITSLSRYLFLVGSSWVPLSDLPPSQLTSSSIVKCRVEASGYYSEEFSLKVAPHQSELDIQANLVPLPGTLTVNAPKKTMRLTINGKRSLILGGRELQEASLAGFSGGKQSWEIPSGRYDIEVGVAKSLSRVSVEVTPGEETRLVISESHGVYQIQKE